MRTTTDVPTHPKQVTPVWLTGVLREAGALVWTRVRSVRPASIGEAQGFIAQLVRFELVYDSPEEGAPSSLVGKFSPLVNELVPPGDLAEGEAWFYAEMAGHPSLAAPRCFYSATSVDAGVSVQILEDVSHLRAADVVAGCEAADVELVVGQLARMHSHWWESPRLRGMSWLPGAESYAQLPFREWWERYPSVIGELLGDVELSATLLEVGDRLAEDPGVFRRLAEPPRTCLHRDLHADNLLFGVAADDPPVVFFDWELVAQGRCATDLTYFLASSVAVERRRRMEKDLLEGYHVALVEGGVRGYGLEQCWLDYRLGIFGKLLITVDATVHYDNTDPQRRAWRRADLQRLEAFLADHAVAELL